MPRLSIRDPRVQFALARKSELRQRREAMAKVRAALAECRAGTVRAIAFACELDRAAAGRALDALLLAGAVELIGDGVYAVAGKEERSEGAAPV